MRNINLKKEKKRKKRKWWLKLKELNYKIKINDINKMMIWNKE